MDKPIVVVSWDDAHSPDLTDAFHEDDLGGVHGSKRVVTLGWLLRDDHEGITVAGEDVGEGFFRSLTFIPRSLVVGMKPVKAPRRSRKRSVAGSSFDEHITPVV